MHNKGEDLPSKETHAMKRKERTIEGEIRAHEIEKGLAPEESINYNHYDSEEDDPSNW